MSRLGKSPIAIPKGVELKSSKEGMVHVKGPKGTLNIQLPKGLSLKIDGHSVLLERDEQLMPESAMHGLFRSLIKNQIHGVVEGSKCAYL